MTAKEKAKELYNKFFSTTDFQIKPINKDRLQVLKAKMLAKMCVDEIIIACNHELNSEMTHFKETGMGVWWLKVKSEIDLL